MLQSTIESQSTALYSTARLWDDGIIRPTDTRSVIGLGLGLAWREQMKCKALANVGVGVGGGGSGTGNEKPQDQKPNLKAGARMAAEAITQSYTGLAPPT